MTQPDAVAHSDSGADQVCAAAATSIWRHAAPTRRSGSQLIGVAVLPPARCGPYFVSSRSACSMRTSFQSTSNSSAMSMGKLVLTPCPISGFLAMMVTTLLPARSEEHTSELQSHSDLVCRLLL